MVFVRLFYWDEICIIHDFLLIIIWLVYRIEKVSKSFYISENGFGVNQLKLQIFFFHIFWHCSWLSFQSIKIYNDSFILLHFKILEGIKIWSIKNLKKKGWNELLIIPLVEKRYYLEKLDKDRTSLCHLKQRLKQSICHELLCENMWTTKVEA